MRTNNNKAIYVLATPNHRERTFTLRKDGGIKYRTVKMGIEEFHAYLNNSQNDWRRFLHENFNEYYLVD